MASTAAACTLKHPSNNAHDIAAFSISFKPQTKEKPIFLSSSKNFSLYPLILHCSIRTSDNGRLSKPFVVAALTAEVDVVEEALERTGDDRSGGGVTVAMKPKKGKAALPLKSDIKLSRPSRK